MKNDQGLIPQMKRLMSAVASVAAASLMLCGNAAHAQANPVIANIYPNGTYQFQPSSQLNFTAVSSVGIAPSAITVQLTGTTLPGQTSVISLSSANGLVVTGTPGNRTVSAPLASNVVYTAVIQVTDANENTVTTNIAFDTIFPSYTFEAED